VTAADRQRIREAIDAHQRARRAREIVGRDLFVCRGCGADTDCRTIGCKVCTERHLKRRLRQDEERRRELQARQNERRRQARMGAP
jgi:hypothetical protein